MTYYDNAGRPHDTMPTGETGLPLYRAQPAPIQSGEMAELKRLAEAAYQNRVTLDDLTKYRKAATPAAILRLLDAFAPSLPKQEQASSDRVAEFQAECAEATRTLKDWDAISSQAKPTDLHAAIPDGWKLVPCEPTNEMRTACIHAEYYWEVDEDWSLMLAAAPTPPAQDNARELTDADIEEIWLLSPTGDRPHLTRQYFARAIAAHLAPQGGTKPAS